jgi:hypothetical protein
LGKICTLLQLIANSFVQFHERLVTGIELANRKLPVVTGGNASSEASHFSQQQARKI